MLLKIQIDEETARRLAETAVDELRPINWQAEAILRKVLGTWPKPKSAPVTVDYNTENQGGAND